MHLHGLPEGATPVRPSRLPVWAFAGKELLRRGSDRNLPPALHGQDKDQLGSEPAILRASNSEAP